MNALELSRLVTENAAIRRRQPLQPVGGKGDKIFPPTYPGEGRNNPPPRHVFERRRIDGREVWCVLVDSVQSQANRLEESLRALIESGAARIPHVVADFSGKGLAGIEKITSLDAPHRVYDAIFRDSLLNSQPFMKSPEGVRLAEASNVDASALLEISPTSLLFGAWHSTGEGGGLGAKFARCLVSEIVAIDVPVEEQADIRSGNVAIEENGRRILRARIAVAGREEIEVENAGRRTSSRIDPLGILSGIPIYKKAGEETWTAFKSEAEQQNGKPVSYVKKDKSKAGKPAVINHGNIKPSVQSLGITCDYLEHTFVLSFAALRRLRFGTDEKKNVSGRAFLAALGLLALAEQDAQGYALRSRCDLVPENNKGIELVHRNGTTANLSFERSHAQNLYREAFRDAQTAGFHLLEKPLRLNPQEKLVDIVRQSQKLALEGEGGEDTEAESSK